METLLPDGVLFCIDCLAHKYDIAADDVLRDEKLVMHVQSISHWAPANIGPYSQSIKVGYLYYFVRTLCQFTEMSTVTKSPSLPSECAKENV